MHFVSIVQKSSSWRESLRSLSDRHRLGNALSAPAVDILAVDQPFVR
jgi:hypothetical protein